MGHEVLEAANGREGLGAFDLHQIDLVITDILMPEKEGIQTIMELRHDFPLVKIIAISGGGAVEPDTYLTMAQELGADSTLSKPFSLLDLEEEIYRLL